MQDIKNAKIKYIIEGRSKADNELYYIAKDKLSITKEGKKVARFETKESAAAFIESYKNKEDALIKMRLHIVYFVRDSFVARVYKIMCLKSIDGGDFEKDGWAVVAKGDKLIVDDRDGNLFFKKEADKVLRQFVHMRGKNKGIFKENKTLKLELCEVGTMIQKRKVEVIQDLSYEDRVVSDKIAIQLINSRGELSFLDDTHHNYNGESLSTTTDKRQAGQYEADYAEKLANQLQKIHKRIKIKAIRWDINVNCNLQWCVYQLSSRSNEHTGKFLNWNGKLVDKEQAQIFNAHEQASLLCDKYNNYKCKKFFDSRYYYSLSTTQGFE